MRAAASGVGDITGAVWAAAVSNGDAAGAARDTVAPRAGHYSLCVGFYNIFMGCRSLCTG